MEIFLSVRVSVHFRNFEQWLGRIMENQHFTWQCEHEWCEDKVDTHKIWNSRQGQTVSSITSYCQWKNQFLPIVSIFAKTAVEVARDNGRWCRHCWTTTIANQNPSDETLAENFTDEVMCLGFVYSLPDSTFQATKLKAWSPWMKCLSVWILLEIFGVMEEHKSTKYTH